ncbi:hypothetical protein T484DRAFT_1801560, partial [Baffinella frigidus]
MSGAVKGKYLQLGHQEIVKVVEEIVKVVEVGSVGGEGGEGRDGRDGTTLTVLRARFKSSRAAHGAGATVKVYQPTAHQLREQLGLGSGAAARKPLGSGSAARVPRDQEGEESTLGGEGEGEQGSLETLVSSSSAKPGERGEQVEGVGKAFGSGGARRGPRGRYARFEGREGRLTRPGVAGCWYAMFEGIDEELSFQVSRGVSVLAYARGVDHNAVAGGVSVLAYAPGVDHSELIVDNPASSTVVVLPEDHSEERGGEGVDVRVLFSLNLPLAAGDEAVHEAVHEQERARRETKAREDKERQEREATVARKVARQAERARLLKEREDAGELLDNEVETKKGEKEEEAAEKKEKEEEEKKAQSRVSGAEALGLGGGGAGEDFLSGMEVYVDAAAQSSVRKLEPAP